MNICVLFLTLSPNMLSYVRQMVLCHSYSPVLAYQRGIIPVLPHRVVGATEFTKK